MGKTRQRVALLLVATVIALSADAVARGGPAKARHRAATKQRVLVLRAPGSPMVLLRSGTFRIGSTPVEVARARLLCQFEPRRADCRNPRVFRSLFTDEMRAHKVTLRPFWIDRNEVTNREYRRCVRVGRCRAPGYAAARAWLARDDHPVTLVSWHDAQRYCRWRGARLPTEAEWERAARGLERRQFPWGNVFNPKILNHGRFALDPLDSSDGFAELAPVGSFPQGNTPEGIADLAGNVEEWVADRYEPGYRRGKVRNPQGPTAGDWRVVRGGSYQSGRPWLRASARDYDLPTKRRSWRGFRCARDRRLPKRHRQKRAKR